jgi:hypothetical protein
MASDALNPPCGGGAAMKGMVNGPGKAAAVLAVVCILSLGMHQQTIAEEGEHFAIGDDEGKMGYLFLLLMCSRTWERSMTAEDLRRPEAQMFLQGREMLIEGSRVVDPWKMREGIRMMVKGKELIRARKAVMK